MKILHQLIDYKPNVHYHEFINTIAYEYFLEHKKQYDLLQNGINYKTRRKIIIYGTTWNKIKYELAPFNVEYYEREINKRGGLSKYKQWVIEHIKEIDDQNKIINEHNYKIKMINNKINKLAKWSDYILYESIKYGLPDIVNNIHRKHDCLGNIIKTYNSCSCNTCEYWLGSIHEGYYTYSCFNCGELCK